MHALQNAFSNVSPWFFSRIRPGRFFCAQSRGKCWIARSWSVMNMIDVHPGDAARAAPRSVAAAVPVAAWPPSIIAGPATAADCRSSLRLSTFPLLASDPESERQPT